MAKSLDEMMAGMGFAPTDTGPNVTELRKIVERQMANGLKYRSGGTWAPEHGWGGMRLPAEERAAAFVEIDRAIEAGHYTELDFQDSNREKVDVRALVKTLK